MLGRLLSGDVRLDTIGQCLCPSDWGCTAAMGMPRDLVSSSVKQADIHLFYFYSGLENLGDDLPGSFFLLTTRLRDHKRQHVVVALSPDCSSKPSQRLLKAL